MTKALSLLLIIGAFHFLEVLLLILQSGPNSMECATHF